MTSYLDTWMSDLRRQTAERLAKRQAAAEAVVVDPRATLKDRIREWWRGLPPEARAEIYHMDTLVRLLQAPPQQLGLALHELGWERRRIWKRGSPYRQTWRAGPAWREDPE